MITWTRKLSVLFVVLSMMFSLLVSGVGYAAYSDSETGNELPPSSAEFSQPVQPKISYGPYRGTDREQKHAYEPFRDNELLRDSEELSGFSYKQDQILIKMSDSYSVGNRGIASNGLPDSSLSNAGIIGLAPINIPVKESVSDPSSGIQSLQEPSASSTWYRASLAENADVMETIRAVAKMPEVIAAEPDYLRQVESVDIPDLASDPQMAEQWYLEQLGITDAWQHLEDLGIAAGGSRDVVVAVIDTGVDYTHPDLAGSMWINTGEIPGNGRDDDGNGYVDDIYGASTVGNEWYDHSGDPADDHGHGTHVAGIIAAQANNGSGGAGVAFNVQIMAIKAAQSGGTLASSDIAEAIYYAVDKGADVINMSFGGYGRSTLEEDALQVAYGTSVLVAAAGNDGKPNLPHPRGADMYPGAYNWVLGVMAENRYPAANGDYLAGFSNWDYVPQDSHEYEVMAPGVEIYSALPGNNYAKWSGTSMATPIVSGIAALLRSKFSDKSSYSSRFIMGQIAATGVAKQGKTYSPDQPPTQYKEVNAFQALTDTPEPKLSYIEHYLFDKPEIAAGNDGDGVIDAGETVDIGMVIRNHWGKADQVSVRIDTLSPAGIPDPYVTLIHDTVEYGAVGNFGIDDNGLIYENDVVTGVRTPFTLQVASDTPNDHVIPLHITLTARNGFDATDPTEYTFEDDIQLYVRKGVELPGVITSDMTLTKDKYWIVPNATLIQEGATVTVEPGTQIQFWSGEPEDPYAEKTMAYIQVKGKLLVQGTAEEPVEMFASSLFPGFEVKIYSTERLETGDSSRYYPFQGYAELNYAKVMNPNIAVQRVDHSYFSQDLFDLMFKRYLSEGKVETINYYGPNVFAEETSNSIFYSLGIKAYGSTPYSHMMFRLDGRSVGNLFDSSLYYMDERWAEDNVYLKNYKLNASQYGDREYWVSQGKGFGYEIEPNKQLFTPVSVQKFADNGSSYVQMKTNYSGGNYALDAYEEFMLAQQFAHYMGGYLAEIEDPAENAFVGASFPNAIIGLNNFNHLLEGFEWDSGNAVDYANWANDHPGESNAGRTVQIGQNGKWSTAPFSIYTQRSYLIEIPGVVHVTGVSLDHSQLTLGAQGASYPLKATVTPEKAENPRLQWTSSDPSVATVDDEGVVTPLSIGEAAITVTTEDGGYTDTCLIQVIEIVPASGIVLDTAELELAIGTSGMLQATVMPSGATNRRVIWSSSDSSVATVDSSGNVTGLSAGTAIITVKSTDGGFAAEAVVSVVVPVAGITLEPAFMRLAIGEGYGQLMPSFQPTNATNQAVDWTSSNEAIVTVDANGTVTPVGQGSAMVTATTRNGGFQAVSIVTVSEGAASYRTVKLAAGNNHTLALNSDGTVSATGNNDSGKLGDGTTINRSTPIQVFPLTGIRDIAAGYSHSVVVGEDGTVWTSGYNGVSFYTFPTQVANISNVKQVAAGDGFTIALKNDGTVWAWGANESGQLGDGTYTRRSEPVQVSNLNNVVEVAAGNNHALALLADGTVWAWGYNSNGQLGDGTTEKRSAPVQVKNLSGVTTIAAGSSASMVLRTDGSVWDWGYVGYYGSRTEPTKVSNVMNAVSIAAGGSYGVAVDRDGSVWTWGSNSEGQLGNGTTASSQPARVPGVTDAVYAAAGYSYTLIIKQNGDVMAWGQNADGQLGDLSTVRRLSPVQSLFGILPDAEPPTLMATHPVAEATNVPPDSKITFTFNETIQASGEFGVISLKEQSGASVSLRGKVIQGNTLTLEPLQPLKLGTRYTARVPAYALKDVFGNDYTSDIVISFQTELGDGGQLAFAIEGTSSVTGAGGDAALTLQDVNALLEDFYAQGGWSTIRNNAILNRWWDPNVNNWMRFTSEEGSGYKRFMANNYWGTTSPELIEKALIHFNDFRNLQEIVVDPILTAAPETAYPFVTDIYLSTEKEERAVRVGAGTAVVHVLFNRDMDTGVQPEVSFGPDMPTTDYTVHAVDGGWVSSREWRGSATITSLTGDGYQFFRVAKAVAADDPWLVTGNDTERFRFEIVTSGTEAMNLQAVGGEGKVDLTWTQDEVELLAGYHLYRSDAVDGAYTRINAAVIPADQKSYTDQQVEPGKTYYYKFTVVKTDLSESPFSNVAAGTPLDTIAPIVTHEPLQRADVGMPLQIFANVTDNVKVGKVELYYRLKGTATYSVKEMVAASGSRYAATIEGSAVKAPGIEYYIQATDGISIVRSGRAELPWLVSVTDDPVITSVSPAEGPTTGGTTVIINGYNFKQGASVRFDQAVAAGVVVESANRIKAISPVHTPAVVDITVENPDGYKHTYLRTYNYKSDGTELSVPAVEANRGAIVEVPVLISQVAGLDSVDLSVQFDASLLQLHSVRRGSLTSSAFAFEFNQNVPGKVMISMSSVSPVSGSGTLAILEFLVLDSEVKTSPIRITNGSLNDGSIAAMTTNGSFTVTDTYTVSGYTRYYSNNRVVPNVELRLSGNQIYTALSDESGQYLLQGVVRDSYTLTPAKSDQANGISSLDASLILQAAVGMIELTANQQIAADVNGNGSITSKDATEVLKKAVDLIELPFSGAGQVWAFAPNQKTYSDLSGHRPNENFTAILIGDVSGNWGGAGTQSIQAESEGRSANSQMQTVNLQSVETALLSLPDQVVPSDVSDAIWVPLQLELGAASMISADITIHYDATEFELLGVEQTEMSTTATLAVNDTIPGEVKIGLSQTTPIVGQGDLLELTFKPLHSAAHTVLTIVKAEFDEDSIPIETKKGSIRVTDSELSDGAGIDAYVSLYLGDAGSTLQQTVLAQVDTASLRRQFEQFQVTLQGPELPELVLEGSSIWTLNGSGEIMLIPSGDSYVAKLNLAGIDPGYDTLRIGGNGSLLYTISSLQLAEGEWQALGTTEQSPIVVIAGDLGSVGGGQLTTVSDGVINNLDFSVWLAVYRKYLEGKALPQELELADLSRDGRIDLTDYELWLESYKKYRRSM